ncbi:TOM22 [Lepeophtheirus salmonis]|uniref:Mitochondrial import receptor subunit TOM22 homolog n=1 Tax=Lepeophtheirus salmonis TaxID=72036 RepID=A0A7R8CQN4_LEPSM|nr:TOM22 [Lepeophtheirus salmonis]CAF2896652.1 TOM22 [Lepeophtheirus salmonis]
MSIITEDEKYEDNDSIIEVNEDEEDIPGPSDSSPEILEIPSSDSPELLKREREEVEEVKRSSPPLVAPAAPPTHEPSSAENISSMSLAKVSEAKEDEDEDEEDDFDDESLVERIVALTEMFPPGVVLASSNLCSFSVNAAKWMLTMSKVVSWGVFSSAGITFLPIIIESERSRIIEAEKQQQRQILLGPGAAVSGVV